MELIVAPKTLGDRDIVEHPVRVPPLQDVGRYASRGRPKQFVDDLTGVA